MSNISHPRGLFYVISVQAWEYFSYYGMRALLILYLTKQLLFSDAHAYALYGAYTSLVYVTPIIGGYIADRYLGNFWSVAIGALLMVAGHTVLSFPTSGHSTLYIALALIIVGYGFFKTNSSCLLGELYHDRESIRDSGFSLSYVGANLGAFLAPIATGYFAETYGWHIGFGIAGLGMFAGLLVFLSGRNAFKDVAGLKKEALSAKTAGISNSMLLFFGVVLSVGFFAVILAQLWAGFVLIVIGIVSLFLMGRIYTRCDVQGKKNIWAIVLFMMFGTLFWAFDQQGGSSITLFIERNVNKDLFGFNIPTSFYQSINPFAVIFGGALVAWAWKLLARFNIQPKTLSKLGIGFLFLTSGFLLINIASKLAMHSGHTSMLWVTIGLGLIGLAEMFIDPVALAAITRLNPANSTGTLAGIYMLVSGSIANFVAAWIATATAVTTEDGKVQSLTQAASSYHDVFHTIFLIALSAFICLIILKMFTKKLLP
ncbi:di-/tripeptide transporter [Photobacterium angustum S14]|uniref:Di-/tripeptide transporter n=1 Tax=Photobacterium angustum (strain S14 / CCUG 15956) TaxID=314292 RepID=Q1ZTG4_PHOAS|nr:oligopeptide:H+ symporter [Photobacterium angustum]EAS66796.1 di-/tripeptide transporter [Photobacterium angustum S14]